MPHPLSSLLDHAGRTAAVLLGAGTLLWLMGSIEMPRGPAAADPALRHETALRATDDLDALRARIGAPDDAFSQARAALGSDMIALREMVASADEATMLGETLATLARYRAAWTELRFEIRSNDQDAAHRARAVAASLGGEAAAALASFGHALDDGNAAIEQARLSAERGDRFRRSALAFVTAACLLLILGCGRHPVGDAANRMLGRLR